MHSRDAYMRARPGTVRENWFTIRGVICVSHDSTTPGDGDSAQADDRMKRSTSRRRSFAELRSLNPASEPRRRWLSAASGSSLSLVTLDRSRDLCPLRRPTYEVGVCTRKTSPGFSRSRYPVHSWPIFSHRWQPGRRRSHWASC